MTEHETLLVEGSRSALIVQDLRSDVIIEGGAFADSDPPEHAKSSDRER